MVVLLPGTASGCVYKSRVLHLLGDGFLAVGKPSGGCDFFLLFFVFPFFFFFEGGGGGVSSGGPAGIQAIASNMWG